ncbi:hypothetical protein [Hamadaea tsunoensis]|uniref:hypothetical protein n=1 Tax=Hamadaea tsunoensis TaxID=53368 RepID=UPI0003FC7CCC|nr:hypothetical protein [Hamadaea tsunoensis]
MRLIRAAFALSAALLLVACTHTSGPGVATAVSATAQPTADRSLSREAEEQAVQQYGQCMRQHGITVSNPHAVHPPEGGRNDPAVLKWQAAHTACQSLLPGGDLEQAPSQQEIEQLRTFAVCMRAHDIPMTDPLPDGNMQINGRFEHVTRTQLEADPVYIAAMAACKDKLPDPQAGKKAGH